MLNLFFPPLCLYCKGYLEKNNKLFCLTCKKNLALIDPKTRCHRCFLELGCGCKKKDNPYNFVASALEYNAIGSFFIHKLKYSKTFYLSKGAASLMFLQFAQLNWPKPDVITSIPMTLPRYLIRGFNQSTLIAKELALLMDTPFCCLLKKRGFTPQQASLNLKERNQLKQCYGLKNRSIDLNDKIVLIIDDVMTTGKTLNLAGKILKSANPKMLLALTLCRTNHEALITNHY